MSARGLGKGFDALIPKDIDRSILEEDHNRVQKLLITDIKPNPDQPRRHFDTDALTELAESVKRHGVIQPLIVVRQGNNYTIVAGERRWRAAQTAQLTHVPAIVRSLQELEQIELALIENIQRVDLSPLEQALSVYRLQHQFNLTIDEIAKRLGKAESTVRNVARLLQLPEEAREALKTGKITEGHARAILALNGDETKQTELLTYILNNSWSVRQAEQFVVAAKRGATSEQAKTRTTQDTPHTRQLSQKLGTKVQIKHKAKGGQIIVHFQSDDQLQQIIEQIDKL
jgi:ParB family chromosome partitioning protein